MTDLFERLREISKVEDLDERGRRLISLHEEMAAGPWCDTKSRLASAKERSADLPELPAEAEEDIRRYLDGVADRAKGEADRLFPLPPKRARRRRNSQHLI